MKRKGILKKTLAIALTVAMTAVMAGCGNDGGSQPTNGGGVIHQHKAAARQRPAQRARIKGKRLLSV